MKKKNLNLVWLALIFCLFFWIPLLNIFFFLPIAIYSSVKQILLVRKKPKKYGGLILAIICLIFSSIAQIFGVAIFVMSIIL